MALVALPFEIGLASCMLTQVCFAKAALGSHRLTDQFDGGGGECAVGDDGTGRRSAHCA